MEITIINKNGLYRELIAKHGSSSYTYLKVVEALEGNGETLSDKEARQLIALVEDKIKLLKSNIQKSIVSTKS